MDEKSLTEYLRKNLRQVGKTHWPGIAKEVGCGFDTLRKFAYSTGKEKEGLALWIVDPLNTMFRAIDRKERGLPPIPEAQESAEVR